MKWAKITVQWMFYILLGDAILAGAMIAMEIQDPRIISVALWLNWLITFVGYYIPAVRDMHAPKDG